MKKLRAGVWRTRDIKIGDKNPTNINFVNVGNQIMFLDTIKYFKESLGSLAASMTYNEKLAIRRECEKFIKKDPKFAPKFNFYSDEEKNWVLNYLSTGKGTLSYKMITGFGSLNIEPEERNFFLPHHFYSSLKDDVMTDKENENIKKFYQTMKLKNLGELNKIHNFQDTIVFCEIFEQRSEHLKKLFKYNPRKCNSASFFSGGVHRDVSKCMIALPTDAEHVRVFEKTLIGGFSCLNTRLVFDTDILIEDKDNEKVLINLNIDSKKQMKRISTKIPKMDENNQFGRAMTKALPYRCIKRQGHPPSLVEFNKILDRISREDNIGHLFTVDIKFPNKNHKTLLFNEIYPPIFEKNTKMEPFERSILQLMSILQRNEEKETIKSFQYNSKTHSTLKDKKFIPLYAEDLHFLIKRAGWLVTHI